MIRPTLKTAAALWAGALYCAAAAADQHTAQALQHASEAVRAGRDAKVLGAQAAEALKHTQDAMAAHADHPELLKQLAQGEEDLKSAVQHASKFNTERAVIDATDAEVHLKAADTAARRLEALQGKPTWPIVR